ncbi:mechanosensitive ion channel protein 6-like [Durio zibethinus]|uniref:Mechanosensitive ion channel protein n=1 Tax=Durio zibethinus TaxID=66656 RepID=A0A6P6AWV1_DURZI|nr:mechanosensitive ion channel protein 6-like [Durio zibethinus]
MEPVRKSLKSYCSNAKQQQNPEEQPLLFHSNDCQMAQSFHARKQREGEIVVNIDSNDAAGKENGNTSKFTGDSTSGKPSGSSKKSKVSFHEVLTEAVRQKSKDVSGQDQTRQRSFVSDGEQFLRCSSNDYIRQNSWRQLVNKTKSRLLDPLEDQYGRNDSMNSEEEFKENNHDEEDMEDIPDEYTMLKFSALTILQWLSLILIVAALVCSLSIPGIKRHTLWDLQLWKWEIMVLALICGRLVSGWAIRLVVIFIERNFLLRKRVLYFVYGLRKAVQNCLWLGLVLLVWNWIFDDKVQEETNSEVLPYVTKILVCFLVATLIWLVKTLLVKVLASSFHVNTFFDRIQEALFNQYVIEMLSGPPLFEINSKEEEEEKDDIPEVEQSPSAGSSTVNNLRATLPPRTEAKRGTRKQQKITVVENGPRFSRTMSKRKNEDIRLDHLRKLNHKNISAWNMRRMVNMVSHGQLATLDEQILNSDRDDESSVQIRSECQANEAAKKIFQNVAKPVYQCIYLTDIMRFMGRDEALKALHLFGAGSEEDGISKASLNNWLVNAFRDRKALALSLNDTKTAVDELHNMLDVVVAIIIVVIWLIILGIPVTHFLVFISSQLLLVVFIFGNTCKTVFEAIIFLFIMHPFDVGDRCEVDGVQMVVEEMNILTTVFLRFDGQKIVYPNSVLSTKPIGNFYRSPDMVETIEFCIHVSTPSEKIVIMKERITEYIESQEHHWHKNPLVVVTDVEDMNKLKFTVSSKHKMNYQNVPERLTRRGHLLEETIKIFKDLDIEYRLLPLDVNVRNMPTMVSHRLPSNWNTCAG